MPNPFGAKVALQTAMRSTSRIGIVALFAVASLSLAAGPPPTTPSKAERPLPPSLKGLPPVVLEAALAVPNDGNPCPTGGEWDRFVQSRKSPAVIEALIAWAERPHEPDANVQRALRALSTQNDPKLLAFWTKALVRAPVHSEARRFVVAGLLQQGDPGLAMAWTLLGEEAQLDQSIVDRALMLPNGRAWLEKARAFAARPGASPELRLRVLNRSLRLTAGEPSAERDALITSPDFLLARLAISTAEPSARTLRLGLESIHRSDRTESHREVLTEALGTLLGKVLDHPDVEANALAKDWLGSKDPVLQVQAVRLPLARWLVSQGDQRGAERLLSQVLASGSATWRSELAAIPPFKSGEPLTEASFVSTTSLRLAESELILACSLEARGARADARKHLAALTPLSNVLEGNRFARAFFASVAGTCELAAIEAVLSQPLVVSAGAPSSSDPGLALTVSNQGQTPVSVSMCVRPDGPLPRGRFTIRGAAPMDVDCESPVNRVVAPRTSFLARIPGPNAGGIAHGWSSWTPPGGPTFWTVSE